jgi:hypothetical protein
VHVFCMALLDHPQLRPLNHATAGYWKRRTKTRVQPRSPTVISVQCGPINGMAPSGHPHYTRVIVGMLDTSGCPCHVVACPMGHACQLRSALNGGLSNLSKECSGRQRVSSSLHLPHAARKHEVPPLMLHCPPRLPLLAY